MKSIDSPLLSPCVKSIDSPPAAGACAPSAGAAALSVEAAVFSGRMMMNSTRRFFLRPTLCLLSAIGLSGPQPTVSRRSAVTPLSIKYFFTDSARRFDSSRL